jgi:hypothetical protein
VHIPLSLGTLDALSSLLAASAVASENLVERRASICKKHLSECIFNAITRTRPSAVRRAEKYIAYKHICSRVRVVAFSYKLRCCVSSKTAKQVEPNVEIKKNIFANDVNENKLNAILFLNIKTGSTCWRSEF